MDRQASPIGRRIKALRGTRAQGAVARAAGMGQAQWSQLERGFRNNPSLATLTSVALGLGIPLAELVDPDHAQLTAQIGIGRPSKSKNGDGG